VGSDAAHPSAQNPYPYRGGEGIERKHATRQ